MGLPYRQKEIGTKLSDTQGLVVSLIDNEKLSLRIWTNTDKYKRLTKRGFEVLPFIL